MMPRKTPDAGLTLIEVLIGVVILMIITSTLAQATWLTTKGKRRVEERQLVSHQARTAMEMMVRDVTLAFLVAPTLSPTGLDVSTVKTAFIGEDQGEADVLHLTSLSGRRYEAGEAASDQREISYLLEPIDPAQRWTRYTLPADAKQLVRREDRTLDDEVKSGGEKAVVAEGLLKLNAEYWDGKKGEWVAEWDSTSRAFLNQLPRAVRITATFANPLNPAGDPLEYRSVALITLGPDPITL